MNRTLRPSSLAVLVLLAGLTGCPDPTDIGHAPKQQVDDARARTQAATAKDTKHLNDAAAIQE